MRERIKEIMEKEIWTTSTIKAGIDKAGSTNRLESIDTAITKVEDEFIIVAKGQLNKLLDLVVEHVTQQVFGKQQTIDKEYEYKEYSPLGTIGNPAGPTSTMSDDDQLEFDFGDGKK